MDSTLNNWSLSKMTAHGALTFTLLFLVGCFSPAQPSKANAPRRGAGEVFLESRWIAGGFGDGTPEWGGKNFRNDMSIGSHLPTHTFASFYVKLYPAQGPNPGDTKISYAARVGEAVRELFHGIPISLETNRFRIKQVAAKKSFQWQDYTFVIVGYTTEDPRVNSYYHSPKYMVRHYLTDIRSDGETQSPSGSLFQMKVVTPADVDEQSRNRVISVCDNFLTNHVLLNRSDRPPKFSSKVEK